MMMTTDEILNHAPRMGALLMNPENARRQLRSMDSAILRAVITDIQNIREQYEEKIDALKEQTKELSGELKKSNKENDHLTKKIIAISVETDIYRTIVSELFSEKLVREVDWYGDLVGFSHHANANHSLPSSKL